MSPLGKLTLAILGLRFFGASGFFVGMFLGHIFIDRTVVIKYISRKLNDLDDNIRIMLPYKYYHYYNLIEGSIFGKIWGAILGGVLFGLNGLIFMFILGHFIFDSHNQYAIKVKKTFNELWIENWAKILGGIIGFVFQSRILLFVGIIIGYFVDSYRLEGRFSLNRISKFWRKLNPLKTALHSREARQTSLVQSMAGLAAKIAKADGIVSENEIRTFKKIFEISNEENNKVSKIFNEAKNSVDGYQRYAQQLKSISKDNLELKESIIENLFKIAFVDGQPDTDEMYILEDIVNIIQLPIGNYEVIKNCFIKKTASSSNQQDFYDVLGIFYNASDCEIKKRWKELINEYHPDRAMSNGASEKEVEECNLKMAEINNAYQSIMKNRKVA